MIALKEFLDDIGGGRSIAMGTVLIVCSYVASNHYVDSVEDRLRSVNELFVEIAGERRSIRSEIAAIRDSQQIDEYERSALRRFTAADGSALDARIARLEKRMDDVIDAIRKDSRAGR